MMDKNLIGKIQVFDEELENLWYIQKEIIDYVNDHNDADFKSFYEELLHNEDYHYIGRVLIAFMTEFNNDTLETTVWGKGQINQPKIQQAYIHPHHTKEEKK